MRLLLLTLLLAALGCSPDRADDDDDDAAVLDGAVDAGETPVDSSVPDAEALPDAQVPEDDVLVWAHSAETLYSFDPRTNTVDEIADFTLPDGALAPQMTDLAVTRDEELYTCSNDSLFAVDPESAVATPIAPFGVPADIRFYGLTFLPEGVLDQDRETLVAATSNGEYYRIDPVTGDANSIGQFSDGYVLSGDIVSVEGAGTYATVKRDDLDSDLLVRLDPDSGDVTPVGSGIGYTNLFGLGYWRQRLYGFSSRGELILIDIEDGEGSVVTENTGSNQFWGAGVTTIAPIGPF